MFVPWNLDKSLQQMRIFLLHCKVGLCMCNTKISLYLLMILNCIVFNTGPVSLSGVHSLTNINVITMFVIVTLNLYAIHF